MRLCVLSVFSVCLSVGLSVCLSLCWSIFLASLVFYFLPGCALCVARAVSIVGTIDIGIFFVSGCIMCVAFGGRVPPPPLFTAWLGARRRRLSRRMLSSFFRGCFFCDGGVFSPELYRPKLFCRGVCLVGMFAAKALSGGVLAGFFCFLPETFWSEPRSKTPP